MNRRFFQRLLVPPVLLWMPTTSTGFQTAVQHSSSTIVRRNSHSTTSTTDGTDDWDSNGYWNRQIRKQGEERPAYQWFKDRTSLPFDCTACGKCCKTKGQVYMTPEEHAKAADLLSMSKQEFVQQYASHTLVDETNGDLWVRLLDQSITSTPTTSDHHGCIFLNEDNTCQIYEARPIQCSTYPFWPSILASRAAWNREVRRADEEKDGRRQDLPVWTLEGGGCEGMRVVHADDEEEEKDAGVPRDQVYEQAYWYEHDDRRFPRSKDNPSSVE